jgi:acyl-[acyl-carrier-protein] desaturase
VAQAAFEVNLLTEDNLPSYHHQLLASFGRDRAWRTWSHRWTAEEGRHAVVLRDYLLVTRNIDPVALERGRMATMQQGWTPDKTALGLMAYAAFQELATRISHRNTGRYSDDPVADKIMVRVAADENLHMMFYRDIVAAALQVDPSAAVEAITEEVIGFDMPGVGIQGFTRKALQMAQAGIYDLRIHHDEILWPLLRYWNLFALEGLNSQAEQARDRLAAHLAKTDRLASRFEAKRMRAAQAQARAS